jgi:hypothetical protein
MAAKLKIEKGDEIKKKSSPLKRSYVKLSSAVGGHLDRRAEPPDTYFEENHPMTISSKFCSY